MSTRKSKNTDNYIEETQYVSDLLYPRKEEAAMEHPHILSSKNVSYELGVSIKNSLRTNATYRDNLEYEFFSGDKGNISSDMENVLEFLCGSELSPLRLLEYRYMRKPVSREEIVSMTQKMDPQFDNFYSHMAAYMCANIYVKKEDVAGVILKSFKKIEPHRLSRSGDWSAANHFFASREDLVKDGKFFSRNVLKNEDLMREVVLYNAHLDEDFVRRNITSKRIERVVENSPVCKKLSESFLRYVLVMNPKICTKDYWTSVVKNRNCSEGLLKDLLTRREVEMDDVQWHKGLSDDFAFWAIDNGYTTYHSLYYNLKGKDHTRKAIEKYKAGPGVMDLEKWGNKPVAKFLEEDGVLDCATISTNLDLFPSFEGIKSAVKKGNVKMTRKDLATLKVLYNL